MYTQASDVFITTPVVNKQSAQVQFNIQTTNPKNKKYQLQFNLFDAAGNKVATALETSNHNNRHTTSLTITHPKLWSPANPYLYKAVINTIVDGKIKDVYESNVGIRKFKFDVNTGFYINNIPTKILGVCMHHDLGALGAAFNKSAAQRQLQLLKDMGCNAIRTAHNMPASAFLDLCDEMGFLVMDEAFDMWQKKKNKYDYSKDFALWHQQDLEAMILRDRNHPSIFMWSIGNEIREQFDSSGLTGTKKMVAIVKALDTTRPVTSALTETVLSKNFIAQSGALDVLGFNYKPFDYDSLPVRFVNKPLIAAETASALETQMRGLNSLKEVSSTIPLPHSEYVITPRTEDAARFGVNTDVIAETGRVATIGDLNSNLAKINLDGRQIPLRVQLNAGAKEDGAMIGQMLVPNSEGVMLPISAVADIHFSAGPSSILRYDRQRQITLEANLNHARLGEGLDAVEQLPALKNLPKTVKRFDTGDAELLGEMFDSFLMAMVFGAMVVLGVLVLLFRTVLQPITIMVALPLSVFGACLALWIFGKSLSLPSVIGILMLSGIVGKNGILLVDCIIETIASGKSRHEAILEAAQQRAKPIVMTSMAMIAGMLPLVLGFGAGNAFREPMAVAVIGGLLASTALSLLFVPVVYVLIDDLEQRVTPKLRGVLTVEK